MFAQERLNIIKSYLREHGKLDVHSVSLLLDVSEVTIRRDLEKLETEGFLKRTHGGAIPAGEDGEPARDPRPGTDVGAEHAELARVAVRLVEDQDVLLILDGPAGLAMAQVLEKKTMVTVLTNSLDIAREMNRQTANRVVLLGGNLDPGGDALYGTLTHQNLGKFHVRRVFAEADGISDDLVVTFNNEAKAALVSESLTSTDELVLLCPSSCFGKKSFYRLGPVSLARRMVTNPQTAEIYKTRIFAQGIQLFTTVNAFEVPG